MSGRNPDGTRYHDPGIKWISYFNGGEAIHGFNRADRRLPPERRLRRGADRHGGQDLAVHADRHARDDQSLIRGGDALAGPANRR